MVHVQVVIEVMEMGEPASREGTEFREKSALSLLEHEYLKPKQFSLTPVLQIPV